MKHRYETLRTDTRWHWVNRICRVIVVAVLSLGWIGCPLKRPSYAQVVPTLSTDQFVAEVRSTYFENGRRLSGVLSLAARRDCHLRYDALAPHGAVLQSFAMKADRLFLKDNTQEKFLRTRPTPSQMNRLLPIAPLGFDGCQWVDLLFGHIEIPEHVPIQRDARNNVVERAEWTDGRRMFEVVLRQGRLVWARIQEIKSGVQTTVSVQAFHHQGIPKTFVFESSVNKLKARMQLSDVQVSLDLDDGLFELGAPAHYEQLETMNTEF